MKKTTAMVKHKKKKSHLKLETRQRKPKPNCDSQRM